MAKNMEKRNSTKKKLKNALIELCNEKPYYSITILDICNRAGAYRSTFYRYYETKDDMLREIECEYVEDTRDLMPTLWRFHADATPEEYEQYRRELAAGMEYHRTHKKLCQFLLSPAGDIYFHAKMVESVADTTMRNLRKRSVDNAPNSASSVMFFASGFVTTIHEWLKNDNCSPQEIADFLLSMMELFLHV